VATPHPRADHGSLSLIGAGIRDAGVALEHEHRLQVGDWLFEARQLPNPGEVLLRANTYYRRPPSRAVPALQLMYPDVHGVWPWEPHCHLFPGQQPMPGTFAA
jgi:hypothetical protein